MYRRALFFLMVASFAGLLVALYAFAHNQFFLSGDFCSISDSFDCDVVNQGPYATINGISVALIGVIGYLFLFLASVLKWKKPSDFALTLFLVLASAGGLLFSLYLTGIEAFVLQVWCLICLTSQVLIAIFFGLSVWVWYQERRAGRIQATPDKREPPG